MEITGKITHVLPLQSGVSASSGKAWKKQEYVLETEETYPKMVHFDFFGEERVNQYAWIKIGDRIKLSFDIESREYNGRWYTNIRGWKAENADAAAPAAAAPAAPVPAAPTASPAFSARAASARACSYAARSSWNSRGLSSGLVCMSCVRYALVMARLSVVGSMPNGSQSICHSLFAYAPRIISDYHTIREHITARLRTTSPE